MYSYQRTQTIRGRYAYRASDGRWYAIDTRTGACIGSADSRREAYLEFISPAIPR